MKTFFEQLADKVEVGLELEHSIRLRRAQRAMLHGLGIEYTKKKVKALNRLIAYLENKLQNYKKTLFNNNK